MEGRVGIVLPMFLALLSFAAGGLDADVAVAPARSVVAAHRLRGDAEAPRRAPFRRGTRCRAAGARRAHIPFRRKLGPGAEAVRQPQRGHLHVPPHGQTSNRALAPRVLLSRWWLALHLGALHQSAAVVGGS